VNLPDSDKTRVETRTSRDAVLSDRDATVRAEAKIRDTDKASGIIGMEVRNRQNEVLGEIKDLVLDINSGKVSYAVLGVGGFLGIREKLIALPPSALQIEKDHSFLVLDADKSRIEAAPGFAATAWPNVDDPQFNTYWKRSSTGGAAETEIRRESGRLDADVDLDADDARIDGQVKTKRDKIYTDADDKKVEVEVKKD
jgi:sporulation protein YlmC with PRC-barrel domain